MAEIASILQVSDLHFYKDLTFAGGRHWGMSAVAVKGHSYSKLYTFARTVLTQRLASGLEDIVIATGDISTAGDRPSLEIAKQFFDSKLLYENGRLITNGLALQNRPCIILPGNHDRYGDGFLPYESATNRDLEDVFGIVDNYPYVMGYRRPEYRGDVHHPTILFYVFDSTLTGEAAGSPSPLRRIARGVLTEADCHWLEAMPDKIRRDGAVLGFDGRLLEVDYENTLRIALLHHHPVRKEKTGLRQWVDRQSWSIAENAERFVQACFNAEVDLVLFGHEHENYNEPERREKTSGRLHTIRFVCCPSTTEYSENRNGFYSIDFDLAEYRMKLYEWNGTAFSPQREYTEYYNRQFVLPARKFT